MLESDDDADSMQQIDTYRKQFITMMRCRWLYAVLVIALLFPLLLYLMYLQVSSAQDRYISQTGLFYYPKSSSKIPAMDIRQAQELFQRRSLRQEMSDKLRLDDNAKYNLRDRITIKTVKSKPNLIVITVSAQTADEALRMVNAMATICVQTYIDFRGNDLLRRIESLTGQKNTVLAKNNQCDQKQRTLCAPLNIISPSQELERLRRIIAEEMLALSENNVLTSNEEAKLNKITVYMRNINHNLLPCMAQIKVFQDNLARLQQEQLKLNQMYTAKNPKIIAVNTELTQTAKEYGAFLVSKGIDSKTIPGDITLIEKMTSEKNELAGKLEFLKETRRVLESELQKNQKHLHDVTMIIPEFERLNREKSSNALISAGIEEDMAEVNLILASIKSDVSQIEEAVSSYANKSLDIKKIILAVFITGLLAIGVWIIITLLHMFVGQVESLDELDAIKEFSVIGAYPEKVGKFSSESAKRSVDSKIYFNVKEQLSGKKIMFVGNVHGSTLSHDMLEGLLWNAAVNGITILPVEIVAVDSEKSITPSGNCSDLLLIQADGKKGILPLERLDSFSPIELELLRNDMEELRKNFDLVMFIYQNGLNFGDELFFKQAALLSDAIILSVGANKTPWRLLRVIAAFCRKKLQTKIPVMLVLSNLKKWDQEDERRHA